MSAFKTCPKCGEMLGTFCKMCPKCFEIIKTSEDTSNEQQGCTGQDIFHCPSCFAAIGDSFKFCPLCGTPCCPDVSPHSYITFDSPNKSDATLYGSSTHSVSAHSIENNTQMNHYHTKTGHGWAAEDANAQADIWRGNKVDQVGKSNELNGADRITNGIPIQTKYCKNAVATVDAAFDANGYRYAGQQLEVPADQYEACLERMKDKIRAGQVKNSSGDTISDPAEAEQLVRKGSVTYEQAKNIAKAGNVDSLIFDMKSNAVTSAYIGGIAFVASFARYKWHGSSTQDALKCALADSIQAGGVAMLVGVASAQVLRTRGAAVLTVTMRYGLKPLYSTSLGKAAIEKIAQASLGKAVYGAAAVNHVSKLLRSNVVTSCIATAVITAPDAYRAMISKNISWAQFGKNLGVNVAGVAGGAGGWLAGTATGAAVGSVVPGIGTALGGMIGGILFALGGGAAASAGAKAGLDKFIKDDADEMLELLQSVFEQLCFDYLLSEKEVTSLASEMQNTINVAWLRDMYGSAQTTFGRKRFARETLESLCEKIVRKRATIVMPSKSEFDDIVSELFDVLATEEQGIAFA